MSRAVSIHIGMNRVDPSHYHDENGDPWDGYLSSCENDADIMRVIAGQAGFLPHMLLSAEATRDAVIEAIRGHAGNLGAGDTCLISYAGHGGQLADRNGDEVDFLDETWCLYDGELLDDELYRLWQEVAPGVRIILVSDSCHSGTIMRKILGASLPDTGTTDSFSRLMPPSVAIATYRANRQFYDDLVQSDERGLLGCGVLTLAACKDQQLSSGNAYNGFFTMALNAAWANGATPSGYRPFTLRVDGLVPTHIRADQTAQLNMIGSCAPDFVNGGIFAH
ncbi:MAG: caspase family protein [Sphingopyxis sp.]